MNRKEELKAQILELTREYYKKYTLHNRSSFLVRRRSTMVVAISMIRK